MRDTHAEIGSPIPSPSAEERPGYREYKVSRSLTLWVVAAPFVGFALAGWVFNLGARGDWEVWKAAVLGALMMVPFGVGAFFGLRSVLKGFRRGWIFCAANVVLGALAIGMPISESLAN